MYVHAEVICILTLFSSCHGLSIWLNRFIPGKCWLPLPLLPQSCPLPGQGVLPQLNFQPGAESRSLYVEDQSYQGDRGDLPLEGGPGLQSRSRQRRGG